MRQLQELLKKFNDSLEGLTAENFTTRLRQLAGEETGIKDQLQALLPKLAATNVAALPAPVRRDLGRVETRSEDVWRATEILLDDLNQFFSRTRYAKYEAVLNAMQQASVVDKLEQQLETVRANRTMSAMQQADFWAKEFERWAKLLEDANKDRANDGGQGRQLTAAQLEFMLKLLRLIQDEQGVRANTRLLERRRAFDDAYGHRTGELAGRQDDLRGTLDQLRAKAPPAAAPTFLQAGKAMTDAGTLLRVPQTDGVTVAAETEVIELLSSGFRQSAQTMAGGGQGLNAMLQQLMQQLGLGAGAAGGGSLAGGSGDLPGAARGPGGAEEREARAVDKTAGKMLDQAPVEFREVLKTYFNEIDKLER